MKSDKIDVNDEVNGAIDQSWRVGNDGLVYRWATKYYPNQDTYVGEFVGSLRHGRGTLTSADGTSYSGFFVDDFFSGKGKKVWGKHNDQHGAMVVNKSYEGEWKSGLFDGFGVLNMGDARDSYAGRFQAGLYHGEGTLTKAADGSITKGKFQQGLPTGKMIITYKDDSRYQGYIKLDGSTYRYHGDGKITYGKKLGSYEGTWRYGNKHGKGTRVFSNENKYTGDFLNNELSGEGIMHYINGDVYNGTWRDGFFHGKGSIRYTHGDSYEGDFCSGIIWGEGTYRYADGGQYTGAFMSTRLHKGMTRPVLDGKRNGYGLRTWTNGSVYEGEWKADKTDGHGVLSTIFGNKYVGTFVAGRRHGQGVEEFGNTLGLTFVCPLGHRHSGDGFCVYTGDYVHGEFHGKGELKCIDGRSYTGAWVTGKKHGEGTEVLVATKERGDPKRLFIGHNGSLYRQAAYIGVFKDNVREGYGIAIYANGDQLLGEFRRGMIHGVVVCKFRSGRSRLALFEMGIRVRWLEGSSKDQDTLNKFSINISSVHNNSMI